MKLKEMSKKDLIDALGYMNDVPTKDPCFSGWNFDETEWQSKLDEIVTEIEGR